MFALFFLDEPENPESWGKTILAHLLLCNVNI